MLVLTSIGALGGLSLLLVTLLVLAHRKLHVDEDPRIDEVEQMLPHANCGACGFPGCRPFAEALVTGAASPGKCIGLDRRRAGPYRRPTSASTSAPRRSGSRGSPAPAASNVARNRARYEGLESCRAAALVAGGGKGCFWGCLGLADCARGLRLRRDPHGRARAAGGRRGQVHRLRRLRRGLPEGPLLDPPGEPPPVGGLPVARGRRRAARGLRGRLHRLRPLRRWTRPA